MENLGFQTADKLSTGNKTITIRISEGTKNSLKAIHKVPDMAIQLLLGESINNKQIDNRLREVIQEEFNKLDLKSLHKVLEFIKDKMTAY